MSKTIKRKAPGEPDKKTKDSFLSCQNMGSADPAISNHFRTELGRFMDGHPGIQKRFTNAEDLTNAIMGYFEYCQANKKYLTMTGLARSLGFRSRQAVINYEKEPGYEFAHDIISYAKMVIEEDTEQRLHDPKNYNIGGAIFSLKNNWGWMDKSEVKVDQRNLNFNGFEIDLRDEERTIPINED